MKTGPSHIIRLYVEAKAMPLKAREAIRGSPSPWKVLAMIAKHAAESVRSDHVSVRVREGAIMNDGSSSQQGEVTRHES